MMQFGPYDPSERRPPSWKIQKSPYVGRGLTDFGDIWQDDVFRTSW